jgi:hypothetical protein
MTKLTVVFIVAPLFLFCTSSYSQITWTEHTISDNFNFPVSVYATDMDGDGDIDVLGTAYRADDITWWENNGDQDFTEHIISDNFDGAYSVYATDVDGDGDIDVLGTAWIDDEITWWENDGDQDFTEHTIDGDFDRASSVYSIDVDGDGDIDVLGTAKRDDEITWWENNGDQDFTEHIINGDFDGANCVYAIDIDGDDDIDILGAARECDDITWWENDGEENFTEHTIDGNFGGAVCVYATDINGDGDIDVLGAAREDYDITWWENDGEENFTEHTIDGDFNGARSVYAKDLDNDGDIDVLGAGFQADEIRWWENMGIPEPPDDFALLSPDDDTEINNFPLWLTWENTTDPTPNDSVRFTVYISPDSTFEDILVTECINAVSDTSVDVIHLTDSTTYWWKVLAEDLHGNQTWSNETWSFTFNWDDPGDELSSRRSLGEGGLSEKPDKFEIVSTYPNPFNSTLTVTIALPETSPLTLKIFDTLGREIFTLANNSYSAGYHLFSFNAQNQSSGIYFIHASVTGKMNEIRKIVLVK